MPGGDGTGPLGWGPQTGRAAGYCAGYAAPKFAHPWPGHGFKGYAYVDEKAMLKRQAAVIREQLQVLEDRLKEVENSGVDD